MDSNKKSEYGLYILDNHMVLMLNFLCVFDVCNLLSNGLAKKKKKIGTYIFSEANVTKCLLLNLDEGTDYSFYYSFIFL